MNVGSFSGEEPLLDALLRDTLPEIKLALGELIDRENTRALPDRYAKLLPETLLAVTLRADAADALQPVAAEVEQDLSDSCTRHGSLYDRAYRVRLRRTEDPNAPLFAVSAHAGSAPANAPPVVAGPLATPGDATIVATPPPLPPADPDATRIEAVAPNDWEPGRWVLVVEDERGEEQEVFRLSEPRATVGRRSEDPLLRTTVALSDVPHVSRRQLALAWEPRGGEPGFRVYNLGLNPLHLGEREIPGARQGRGPLRLEGVAPEHAARVAPGEAIRIGDQGPTLRIREVPAPPEDPDATVFE